MPDGLYERDILAWSQTQADLLRRLSRGERVNDVDWANVVEEIESVGRSELNSAKSFLRLIIAHVLKLSLEPHAEAGKHWRQEVALFQASANDSFSPSMRQLIDVDRLYQDVIRGLLAGDKTLSLPASNPFGLDALLTDPADSLLAALPARNEVADPV